MADAYRNEPTEKYLAQHQSGGEVRQQEAFNNAKQLGDFEHEQDSNPKHQKGVSTDPRFS